MSTYVCIYAYIHIYTYKHSRGIREVLKGKRTAFFFLMAESLAHSALEVTPCQKVLRIDKHVADANSSRLGTAPKL